MAERTGDPRFRWTLAVIVLVGLAIRVGWILASRQHVDFGGDAGYYHRAANLLVDGHGFVSPYNLVHPRQAADHPPLYTLWLAIPSLVGLRSQLDHLLWSAVLGAGTIAVIGLAGREIGGRRVGLVAAVVAAVYPNLWVPDGSLMAETASMMTVAVALLYAYRYWRAPTWPKLAVVGLAAGAGALTRSELVLIVPLMVLPLAVLVPGIARADRWRGVLAGALAALAVMAPWLGYNLARFKEPELLSTQFGLTLSSANCDLVWHGYHKSYFDIRCSKAIEPTLPKGLDESQQDARHRRVAFRYVRDHSGEIPRIVAARVGAILGLYQPEYQITLDGTFEGRGMAQARAGAYSFWALAVASVAGAVVLRRRRSVPVFPLLVPPVMVLVTVVTVYASTRFRASAEVSLCLLTAVAAEAAWRRLVGSPRKSRDSRGPEADGVPPGGGPPTERGEGPENPDRSGAGSMDRGRAGA